MEQARPEHEGQERQAGTVAFGRVAARSAVAMGVVAAVLGAGLTGFGLAADTKAESTKAESKTKPEPQPKADPGADATAPMKSRGVRGTLKSSTADTIVVAARDKEWTFAVDSKTTIVQSGKAVAPTDLKAGDRLVVRYVEHDGKAVAEHVMVGAGRHGGKRSRSSTAKPPTNPCAAAPPANPSSAK